MPLWRRQLLFLMSLKLLRLALAFRRLGLTDGAIMRIDPSHFLIDRARGLKRLR